VVGFCYGGGMTHTLTTRLPELNAAVPFYGNQPPVEDAAKVKTPLLIHFAAVDERINASWPAYEAALKAAGAKLHRLPVPRHAARLQQRHHAALRRRPPPSWPGNAPWRFSTGSSEPERPRAFLGPSFWRFGPFGPVFPAAHPLCAKTLPAGRRARLLHALPLATFAFSPPMRGPASIFHPPFRTITMNLLHKIAATAGLLTLAFGTAQAQNKELVVGSSATYRPFAYESPTKEIVGYDVDMIKAIAQKAGLQIKIVNTPGPASSPRSTTATSTWSSPASPSTTSASSPTTSPPPTSKRAS
jgi:hypothetical protein